MAAVATSFTLMAHPALAQTALPDPTRPPDSLEGGAAAKPGGPALSAGLQTVILRKGRKPVALINGEMVELGGKLGEATLIRLSEREAVLQGPLGREVLRLTPSAQKRSADGKRASNGKEDKQ